MSGRSDLIFVDIKKHGNNCDVHSGNKQKHSKELFPNPNSLPNINIAPHDRLLSVCSGVEPAVSERSVANTLR